jgi:hypothetical protein
MAPSCKTISYKLLMKNPTAFAAQVGHTVAVTVALVTGCATSFAWGKLCRLELIGIHFPLLTPGLNLSIEQLKNRSIVRGAALGRQREP